MDENIQQWEDQAQTLEWLVPWRYVEHKGRWFVGGYSNVALNAIDRHLPIQAQQIAVWDFRGDVARSMSLFDVYQKSSRLARWWYIQGVRPGDRVAIVGKPCLEGLVAWIALSRLGAVVVRTLTSDSETLARQVGQQEVLWMVEPRGEMAQPGNCLLKPVGLHAAIDEISWDDAIARSPGLLDPIGVEASSLGAIVYGDRPVPYLYTALGSLMGWRKSLIDLLDLKPDDIVAIDSEYGGLMDLYPLTLTLLSEGAKAYWISAQRLAHLSDAVNKAIVQTGHESLLWDSSLSFQRVVVMGPDRPSSDVIIHDSRYRRAYPDPSQGLYTVSASDGEMEDAPCVDQNDRDTSPSFRLPHVESPVIGLPLSSLASVKAWCYIATGEGLGDLWLQTACSENEVMDALRERLGHPDVAGKLPRLLCVPRFPETIEGRLATWILRDVSHRQDPTYLEALINPDILPTLRQAQYQADHALQEKLL